MINKNAFAGRWITASTRPNHKASLQDVRRFVSRLVLGVVITIAGANSASAAGLEDVFKSITNGLPSNPFDLDGSAFNKLVDADELDKAQAFFSDKYSSYFDKRFNTEKKEVTPQLQKLGKWLMEREYRTKVTASLARLVLITDLTSNVNDSWKGATDAISDAQKTAIEINGNDLLRTSRVADEATDSITRELARVYDTVRRDRQKALASTFEEVLRTGQPIGSYPRSPFTSADYRVSAEFQAKVLAALNSLSSETQVELATTLKEVIAPETGRRVAKAAELKKRLAQLGTGPYPLEKLSELRGLVKDFGAESGLDSAVKIGFVDLTATSFKERNVFDFELTFEKDYGLLVADANESFLAKATSSGFDYIFVTDLSAAKILREFKNKREIPSRLQTGVRQEQNPEYVGVITEYQRAMSRMQAAKIESANNRSKPCYGNAFSCALLSAANGLSASAAESDFNKSAEVLARTPQTVTKPVYSKYSYQLVDISASKLARVDYYVIDVNRKKVYSNYFEVKDSEKFTVSYNVENEDPDAQSILSRNGREEDVTEWEKRPITVKLSTLFDPANISQAPSKPFTSVEAFLKPLASRQYASAGPTYVNKTFTKTDGKTEAKAEIKDSATRGESGAIADERFDSILILKTPKAVGTGFYVTPDLILTAAHVVDGSSLVQMTYYDGTKSYGKVVDSDVRLDLALIKAQTVGKPLKMHVGPIRLGETAEAIGHPKGYEFTITRGVVSAIRKQPGAMLRAGPPIEFIQTDTPISPGNSGGPLFLKDAVIGVNDWVRVDKASQNLNFSVSYNEIREYLNRFEGKNK